MNSVFLVEYTDWDCYDLLGVYDNIFAALDHVNDENFINNNIMDRINITRYWISKKKNLSLPVRETVWKNGKS